MVVVGEPRCRCHGNARRRILGINFPPPLKSEPRGRDTGRGAAPGLCRGLRSRRCRLALPPRLRSGRAPACGLPPGRGGRGRAGGEPYCRAGGESRAGLRRVSRRPTDTFCLLSRCPRRPPPLLSFCLIPASGQASPSMPIAHLLELWKGIEVEPMETEVSGGGCGRAGGRSGAAKPPPHLPRRGNRLGAAPNLARWGAMRRAGRRGARLGNLLPHSRSGLWRGGGVRTAACAVPPPSPAARPPAPAPRLGRNPTPGILGVNVGEGVCKTDGNPQSGMSRTWAYV